MCTPIVSIVITTFKRSDRLLVAIESSLQQTYNPIEVIVVDDNNDDEYRKKTKKILEPYIEKGQVVYTPHGYNQGGCAARNTGAKYAKGEYLAFLDDDDFYEPTKIESQMKLMQQQPQFDACMCDMFRVDENGNHIESRENIARGTSLKEAILDGNLFTSMLLIKTQVFKDLKGFSEIPRFQDKYFHYKFLSHHYQIGVFNKPLLTLVEHNDNRISSSVNEKVLQALDALRQFETNHKHIFSKKEWRYLSHRFYYKKAYELSEGNLKQKLTALYNILLSLGHFTGDFSFVKLALKSATPNFILNLRKKRLY